MQEIERKYLLRELPSVTFAEQKYMCQYYISIAPEIRLRSVDSTGFKICTKSKGLIVREEIEEKILKGTYGFLKRIRKGIEIQKVRHLYDYAGFTWEIDEYECEYKGLFIAEIELKSIDQEFLFPPEFQILKDVSEVPEYKNHYLATHFHENILEELLNV